MLRRTAMFVFLTLFLALLTGTVIAQDDGPVLLTATSSDLLKVNILFVGAHPDDDSVATATMARYALDHGMKVGVITATRGEGGGNAIGIELGPSLGIMRELEERRALGMLGIPNVFYLNELDWAFTTSATATEQFWGYEEPLGNLVRFFRVLRPDVVITMNPIAGHGHHQYAARLASEAYFLAADESAFPEQLSEEFLETWQPKKLYYGLAYGGAGLTQSLQIPTNEFSPSQYATYAELEEIALRMYRSQGFDSRGLPPSARALNPETFTLAASVLPVPEGGESDLMAGVTSGVDQAPEDLEMLVEPGSFFNSQGGEVSIDVTLRNFSGVSLSDVNVTLEAPDGWTVGEGEALPDLAVGDEATTTFTVSIPEDADVSDVSRLLARFTATDNSGVARSGSKPVSVRVTPPVTVEMQPIQSVQIFREWTQRVGLPNLIGLAPTQIAIGEGENGTIPVILTNRSSEDVDVTVSVSVDDPGVTLDADEQEVTVPAGEQLTVDFSAAIPEGTAQSELPVTAQIDYGDYSLTDAGTLQIVPVVSVERADPAPDIDGDLSEFADLTSLDIPFDHLWEGETTSAADLTGSFQVSYDDEFLYVAVQVIDDVVVSNIAPNDIKGHWRSDSVEITIDPQGAGASEHTLTTFKTGIFPFDTEGNVQAERDADANQGIISVTAPDMLVASARTDEGYNLEVAIPWNAVPGEVEAGDSFGFNVLIYDCDKDDAAVGENCNEARTAWSAWGQIQGNPRLWGHATLEAGS